MYPLQIITPFKLPDLLSRSRQSRSPLAATQAVHLHNYGMFVRLSGHWLAGCARRSFSTSVDGGRAVAQVSWTSSALELSCAVTNAIMILMRAAGEFEEARATENGHSARPSVRCIRDDIRDRSHDAAIELCCGFMCSIIQSFGSGGGGPSNSTQGEDGCCWLYRPRS